MTVTDVGHTIFHTRKITPDDGTTFVTLHKRFSIKKGPPKKHDHAHDEHHDRHTRFNNKTPKHLIINRDGHREHKLNLSDRKLREYPNTRINSKNK